MSSTDGVWEICVGFPVPLAIVSADGGFVKANDAFCEMVDHTEVALTERNVSALLHVADVERHETVMNDLLAKNRPFFEIETRFVSKKGSTIWARVIGTAIPGKSGRDRVALLAQDISHQLEVSAELQESRQNFAELCEASTDGVIIHNGQRIVYANNALVKLLRLDPSHIEGMLLEELFASDSGERAMETVATADGQAFDTVTKRSDGLSLPVRLRTRRTRNGRRVMLLTTVHQLTAPGSQAGAQAGEGRPLSLREREVFRLFARGHDNVQIANRLRISRRTVEHHVSHILTKLGVANRTAAVLAAHRNGLLDQLE